MIGSLSEAEVRDYLSKLKSPLLASCKYVRCALLVSSFWTTTFDIYMLLNFTQAIDLVSGNLSNTLYLFSFVETRRKFIIAEHSIRKLGSSSVLIILMKIQAYGSKALQ